MEREGVAGKVGDAHKTRGERTPIRTHTKSESPSSCCVCDGIQVGGGGRMSTRAREVW